VELPMTFPILRNRPATRLAIDGTIVEHGKQVIGVNDLIPTQDAQKRLGPAVGAHRIRQILANPIRT
jgi:hypothetical protein